MSAPKAGPPSPSGAQQYPGPGPTNVLMIPVTASTLRTELAALSEMYRFPAVSKARPAGFMKLALTKGPPSPEVPDTPVPYPWINPVFQSMPRIFRALASAKQNRDPNIAVCRTHTWLIFADSAGPPSP